MASGLLCTNLANGTERNHEPTERVSQAALRGHARRHVRVARRALRVRAADERRGPEVRADRGPGRLRGQDRDARRRPLPLRRRRRGRARDHPPPGAAGIVAHDDTHLWLVRQPREAIGDPDFLEIPAGRLDQRGRVAASGRAARTGRGDRQGASPWERITSSTCRARHHRRGVHLFHATGLSRRAGRRRGRAHRDRPWPLDDLDGALAATRDAKTIIGLRRCCRAADRAARACCARPAGEARRGAARSTAPWPSHARQRPAIRLERPGARLPRLPRVRARAVAQHARGVPLGSPAVRRVPGPPRHRRPHRRARAISRRS